MISQQTISELSTKYQTSEQNIAREYAQNMFLSHLYNKNKSEKLIFKGGTALRIIFKSPRFSEDLDFSSVELSVKEINQLIDLVLVDLKKEGVIYEKKVNPGTEGETTGGYYVILNLKFLEFDTELRVQVSFRNGKALSGKTVLIENDFIPPYTLVYLHESFLVKEKIEALIERHKPRDFFDLYYILRSSALVKYLPKDIDNLRDKLLELSHNGWEKELKIFLPTNFHNLIRDFSDRLKREIEIHIPSK